MTNDPQSRPRGRDAPQSAARTLLASGRWVTAAEYADLLGDALTPEAAEQCYARLCRAGWKDLADPAERIRLGRVRLAQQALQRLVQRGEAEGIGEGTARTFRIVGTGNRETEMFAPRPKPKPETVPLERLTFSPDLQMRHIFDEKGEQRLFSEEWVAELLAQREAGAVFEPLEAVKEERKGKEPVYWVFRGFHRGEVYRRAGVNSVEVLVYPGTPADAQFYALAENSKQPLPRTPDDCRRAFDTMLDTPHLFRRVMEAAPDEAGVYRAMMAACGLSKGAVGKYLKARGLHVDRKTHKLVEIPAVDLSPPPEISPARASEPEEREKKPPPPPRKPAPAVSVSGEDPELAGAKTALAEIARMLRKVGEYVGDVLRSPVGERVRRSAEVNGVPFVTTMVQQKPQAINDPGQMAPVESWPTFASLQAVFAQVSAAIATDEVSR